MGDGGVVTGRSLSVSSTRRARRAAGLHTGMLTGMVAWMPPHVVRHRLGGTAEPGPVARPILRPELGPRVTTGPSPWENPGVARARSRTKKRTLDAVKSRCPSLVYATAEPERSQACLWNSTRHDARYTVSPVSRLLTIGTRACSCSASRPPTPATRSAFRSGTCREHERRPSRRGTGGGSRRAPRTCGHVRFGHVVRLWIARSA